MKKLRQNPVTKTRVVADLIGNDFRNQTDATNYGFTDDRDQVSGYTIRQIEDALKGQETWEKWKDNIKNRYDNVTEDNLDALFAYWNRN